MPELVMCTTKGIIMETNTLDGDPSALTLVCTYVHVVMKDIQPSKEPSEFTSNLTTHPSSGWIHSKWLVSSGVHRCKVGLIDYKTEAA